MTKRYQDTMFTVSLDEAYKTNDDTVNSMFAEFSDVFVDCLKGLSIDFGGQLVMHRHWLFALFSKLRNVSRIEFTNPGKLINVQF